MEFNFSSICRICLHEGEMHSIFESDESEVGISAKIYKCGNITIKPGMNLPEHICSTCLEDLNVAYRFRTNCESSDAILQSLIENIDNSTNLIVSSSTGELYKYTPPSGLNIKRIRPVTKIKIENEYFNGEENEMVEEYYGYNEIEDNQESECVEGRHLDEDEFNTKEENVVEEEIITSVIRRGRKQIQNTINKTENDNLNVIKDKKLNTKPKRIHASREKIEILPGVQESESYSTIIQENDNSKKVKPAIICEICGNLYKYRHALENHMRRHRNEKPFACEICGRAFVINFELRRHMRTHTGQKPYMCKYCGRRFSDYGSRIKHERTHTGERPYACETCGKTFSYSHVLSSHILTHTGEKRFVCNICGKRFTKSHHLKAHNNMHLKRQNKSSATVISHQPTVTQIESTDHTVIEEIMHAALGIKQEEQMLI